MPSSALHFGFLLLLAGSVGAPAQWDANVQTDVGSPHLSIGDRLQVRHIELTKPSLIQALKSPDSEVRGLAAVELQEMKVTDAIPAIKDAMTTEKVPRAQVNIAVALGVLGDPAGREELRSRCADKAFPPEFRLSAVRYMFDLHVEKDEDCLQAAEEIVQRVDSDFRTPGYRVTALSLLPRFQNLTPEESQRVFGVVVQRLEDSDFTVREEASRAVVDIGNPAGITYLEAAIAKEPEEGSRSFMERELQRLEKSRKP